MTGMTIDKDREAMMKLKPEPITEELSETSKALVRRLKHLPGRHPQKSHGRGSGSGNGSGSSADFNKPAVRTGVMIKALTYEDHAKMAKDIFNALPPETQARITETEARIKAGTATIDKYRDKDGNWDPEREKLHDQIVADVIGDTTSVDKPQVLITGGLPGSGKSSVLKERGEDLSNRVHIDSDAIKAKLPEYEGWNAALLHEEASHIVGRVLVQSVSQKKNVIYDATLKTEKSARDIVGKFESVGYDSKVVFVDVPMESAMNRAVSRFMGPTNRYVPLDYLATHDTKNLATMNALKSDVDNWEHWDNSQPYGQPPTLVAQGGI